MNEIKEITCRVCGAKNTQKEFCWKKKGVKYMNICKECQREKSKNHYKNNKQQYRERNAKYRKEFFVFIREYFETHHCVDCGESNSIVLEFDHIDEKTKEFAIGAYLKGSKKPNFDKIKKEIKKCEVRCSNCHKIRTAKQMNYYSYLI